MAVIWSEGQKHEHDEITEQFLADEGTEAMIREDDLNEKGLFLARYCMATAGKLKSTRKLVKMTTT